MQCPAPLHSHACLRHTVCCVPCRRHYWFFREGHDGQRMVQVNSYPPLRSSRTSDWGWRLENAMVQLVM